MRVMIHDLHTEDCYQAASREECKCETDKQVYDLVVERLEVITMGKVIGHPHNPITATRKPV
jgi:hypothetical protein